MAGPQARRAGPPVSHGAPFAFGHTLRLERMFGKGRKRIRGKSGYVEAVATSTRSLALWPVPTTENEPSASRMMEEIVERSV